MSDDSNDTPVDERYGCRPVQQGTVPDFAAVRDEFREALVRFIRTLREAGADVPANAGVVATRAVVETGFERRKVRIALRTTLVATPRDVEIFNRLFPAFWHRLTDETSADVETDAGALPGIEKGTAPDPRSGSTDGVDSGEQHGMVEVSPSGRMGSVDTPEKTNTGDGTSGDATIPLVGRSGGSTEGEFAVTGERTDSRIPDAVEELTEALGQLRGRGWTTRRNGDSIDIRRALRESATTGGTVVDIPRRRRVQTDVRASIIVDVSESVLDVIDRTVLLEVLYAAVDRWRTARVFFFDTELKEVTAAFDARTMAEATLELQRAETAWGGGTRIGENLTTLRRSAPGAVDRRTVVLLVSDGIDVGGLDELAEGMAWLGRTAALVLWLNPLAGRPDYEPTARGMATALPYVDGLFPFTSPDDLRRMAAQLRQYGPRRSLGYHVSSTSG